VDRRADLSVAVVAYMAVSVSYSLALKHVPVLELGCVASGFVLRAMGRGPRRQPLQTPRFATAAGCLACIFIHRSRARKHALLPRLRCRVVMEVPGELTANAAPDLAGVFFRGLLPP
jgi:hypothetical protein